MALSPTSYRFTVKDYHRMAEAEIFGPDDRVELLDGRVFDMAPIGSRHAACVRRLARLFSQLGDQAIVGVQDPIQLGDLSEPQPDVVLLRPEADFYARHHPMPPEVLLVVEVADTTVAYDRETKVPLYLAAQIPEVWLVDLPSQRLEVFRGDSQFLVGHGGSVAPEAFPGLVVDVADVFG